MSASTVGERRRSRGGVRAVAARLAFTVAAVLVATVLACDGSPTDPPLPPIEDLPADLAAIELTATGSLGVPYVVLEVRHPEGFSGFLAVNGEGRPVWYFRTTGAPFSFTRRSNGNLVVLDQDRGLVEVRPDGTVVRELAQEARPGRRMHHDVTATPDNTILFLAEDVRPVGDEDVTGEALWEWVPETGEVTLRWSSFDHLDWTLDRGERSRPDDWLHANSLAFGPAGNILVSFHFLNQVVSIAPDYAGLEWRLGGVRATLPVPDPPFSGQHTARSVGPDRILLFDNGYEREVERYSRAVEYSIAGGTAMVAWEWRPDRDNWARVISSALRMPNGHTLVGFGTLADAGLGTTGPIEVYEVDPGGAVRWHLEVGGDVRSMYRATPMDGLEPQSE